ncbi:unnamed protein product, partial [Ectocarpus sp. 12 AP-2014]
APGRRNGLASRRRSSATLAPSFLGLRRRPLPMPPPSGIGSRESWWRRGPRRGTSIPTSRRCWTPSRRRRRRGGAWRPRLTGRRRLRVCSGSRARERRSRRSRDGWRGRRNG